MSEPAQTSDQALDFGAAGEGAGYRVLARKYRPASFNDLIGQDARPCSASRIMSR